MGDDAGGGDKKNSIIRYPRHGAIVLNMSQRFKWTIRNYSANMPLKMHPLFKMVGFDKVLGFQNAPTIWC